MSRWLFSQASNVNQRKMFNLFKKKKQEPPKPPFDERISEIVTRLMTIQHRMDSKARAMQMRGRELFNHVVRAKMEKDEERAAVYANELAQLRKMMHATVRSQASLEGVVLRLEAVKDYNEVRKVIGPVAAVVMAVQKDVGGVMPEISYGLRGVQDLLEDLSVSVGTVSDTFTGYSTSDPEAEAILREASEIAAQRLKKEMPDIEGGHFIT
ncbi:MAG: Snf7 family protein [Candidatus Caldarchaeum sp.]|nr:Snf7 family protein [Candidatus Caldarchaeum sp.]MCX8200851.1 Snf7 family protein [Candidatus Caldarchaeum sp.]MDW8063252.1 Snf7 family protein [Candidatus Caldarchaeum sp.]MDW8436040.1 Snf7 family protein [Candidatus Caldarchaeum sp.]